MFAMVKKTPVNFSYTLNTEASHHFIFSPILNNLPYSTIDERDHIDHDQNKRYLIRTYRMDRAWVDLD